MPEPAKDTPRTFTESEAYALVADNVKRETADLTKQVETLTAEKAAAEKEREELQKQVDVTEAAKTKAEQDLADYKAEQEKARETAARRGERTDKVREVAKHLKDEFYTDARMDRWAAMDDEAFDAYVAELAEVSAHTEGETKTDSKPPRETAMAGTSVSAPAKAAGLAGFWGIDTQKGGN